VATDASNAYPLAYSCLRASACRDGKVTPPCRGLRCAPCGPCRHTECASRHHRSSDLAGVAEGAVGEGGDGIEATRFLGGAQQLTDNAALPHHHAPFRLSHGDDMTGMVPVRPGTQAVVQGVPIATGGRGARAGTGLPLGFSFPPSAFTFFENTLILPTDCPG
jgi:hypothetical protein